MKFTQVELDNATKEYDVLYEALVDAHKAGKSIRVELEGKHHGTILLSLRRRHKYNTDGTLKGWAIGSSRDAEHDALILTFRRNRGSEDHA